MQLAPIGRSEQHHTEKAIMIRTQTRDIIVVGKAVVNAVAAAAAGNVIAGNVISITFPPGA